MSGDLRGVSWPVLLKPWVSDCFVQENSRFLWEDCRAQGSGGWNPVPSPHPLITHLRDMQSCQDGQRSACQGRLLSNTLLYLWETEIKHNAQRQQTHSQVSPENMLNKRGECGDRPSGGYPEQNGCFVAPGALILAQPEGYIQMKSREILLPLCQCGQARRRLLSPAQIPRIVITGDHKPRGSHQR